MDWNKVDLVRVYKATRTVLVTEWHRSNLGKIRFFTSSALFLYVGLWYFDYNPSPDIATYLIIANTLTAFWPNILGNILAPILRRTMTLVAIDDRNQIVTPYNYDASWNFFQRTPDLAAWYRDNCRGFMGVLPKRPSEADENHRVFWFTRKDDAFAFKMRWS
ncbi:MAG: hypothetical protein EOO77_27725 [Oxalobacteraceae bacterium]|nr:MAG: hypothetical protein EOO77_27725 [Oxalobacteraceae bacterium]